jgi:replicative DNA helicase
MCMNLAWSMSAALCVDGTEGKEGAPVAFFSLETSGEQLGQRVLAEQSGILSEAMRKGQVRARNFHRFAEITQQHAALPLYIEPTSNLSTDEVRTRARRLKRQYGISLLIIDIESLEITRSLKSTAKDLNIPVLALP